MSFHRRILSAKYPCLFADCINDKYIRELPLPFPILSGLKSCPDELIIIAERKAVKNSTEPVYLRDPNGKVWKAKGILIGPRAYSKSAKTIQIFIKETIADKIILTALHTQLPIEQQEHLLNFIKTGRPCEGFCCLHFADYVFGKYQ